MNWLLFILFGYRGKPCRCGFSKLAHSHPEIEFDIDRYPCSNYVKGEQ